MQKVEDGRVAVNICCSIRFDEEEDNFVAHFTDLGLVARGYTEEEAINNCKQLFNKYVRSYRQYGQLEKRLNQSGAKWWWLEEYPVDSPEPENTDLLMSNHPTDPKREIYTMNALTEKPREFAVAA